MAIQNDNTLVTKGDLKELYTDKIAPYLGGGINYYYTDRTGEELKSIDMRLTTNQSISANTSQNTLLNFDKSSGTYAISDHKVIIPAGERVQINVALQASPGDSGTVDGSWQIYDYKNNTSLADANFTYVGGGYAWSSAKSIQYTAPENGALIGVKITGAFRATVVTKNSSFTIQEIGRIVDPVKYVSNNSDLQETPVGNIISYMGNTVPKHYLACNGQTYSIGTYPELEAFIINEFGSINYFGGNGTTNWAVPDLRGEFLRGTGTNSHTDQGSGANVGVHQNATEESFVQIDKTNNIAFIGISNNINNTWTSANYDSVPKRSTPRTVYTLNKTVTTDSYSSDTPYTSRPTNTSVNYCIKYESTYHAFFSNAAYKVEASFGLSYNSTLQSYVSYSMTYITGDSSLMDGNYFIAPVDGWYMVSFKSNQISYSKPAVQYLQINDVSADAFTDATGSGTSHSNFGVNMTHTIYLSKGDKVNYRVWTNGNTISLPSVRRASFCLLTSNYNPTIVSADTVYSENEQMVGYWKDGKPLYQKTFVITTPSSTNYAQVIGTIHDNCDLVVNFWGLMQGSASNRMRNGNEIGANRGEYFDIWADGKSIYALVDGGHTNKTAYITVQYTKTTDTASSLQVENSLLLNRPDLWTPGTEYHFGGGLYGIRKTGTITAAIDECVWTAIVTTSSGNLPSIVDSGGWIKWGDEGTHDYKYSINSTLTGLTGWGNTLGAWSVMRTGDTQIALWNTSGLPRTNAPYDVWVTYTK